MTRLAFLAASFLALASCGLTPTPLTAPPTAPMPPQAVPPPSPADPCSARAVQRGFIGQDATPLLATTFRQPVRFVRPGDRMTTDLRPDRLNIELDGRERVVRAYCG